MRAFSYERAASPAQAVAAAARTPGARFHPQQHNS